MIVARSQSPILITVTYIISGISRAVRVVDQLMVHILRPVISIGIGKVARIQSEEGIVRKEQWSAVVIPQRKVYIVKVLVTDNPAVRGPSIVIDRRTDRMVR